MTNSFVVTCTGFKCCRFSAEKVSLSVLSLATPNVSTNFNFPACWRRNFFNISVFLVWHGTPTNELFFYKARPVKGQCLFATRIGKKRLRMFIMLGYIQRSLNILHSSCTRIRQTTGFIVISIEAGILLGPLNFCLEFVDSISKRLQRIWLVRIYSIPTWYVWIQDIIIPLAAFMGFLGPIIIPVLSLLRAFCCVPDLLD